MFAPDTHMHSHSHAHSFKLSGALVKSQETRRASVCTCSVVHSSNLVYHT